MTQRPDIVVLGAVNVDAVCRLPGIVRPGETTLALELTSFHGGKGGNQAVAAARMGAKVAMVSAVGTDANGPSILANLERHGIDTTRVARLDGPSGQAWVQISADGENAIIVHAGANAHVPPPTPEPCKVFVCQMELDQNLVTEGLQGFCDSGATTVLNLAPMPEDASPRTIATWLQNSTYLIVNAVEWEALARCMHTTSAAAFAAEHDVSIIITRGSDGAELVTPASDCIRIAADPVNAVDTTGAGDTFVGIFAAKLVLGASPAEAMGHATRGASIACGSIGAQSAMPGPDALARPS